MKRTNKVFISLLLLVMLSIFSCMTAFAASSSTGFSLADLSSTKFEFTSGAGAWSTNLTIFKDGHFRGQYHDSNMGETGEGYKNGTEYISNFSGSFTEPVKVDNYTYQVTIKDLKYQNEPNNYIIADGTKYVYSIAYGLTGNTFYFYLPGTPLSKLNGGIKSWIKMGNQNEQVLTMYVLADMDNKTAFMSYNTDIKQDALDLYENSKRSYESMKNDLATVEMNQLEMNNTAKYMYDTADYCLNYMWDVIKYTSDSATYQKLLEEQRTWVKGKEQKAKDTAAENMGGSLYNLVYYGKLTELTYARCDELSSYIKNSGTGKTERSSNNYANYAGTYTSVSDGSTFTLKADGAVNISITRLTTMDGKATDVNNGIISVTVKDANENDMKLTFNSKTMDLVVKESTWNYLPNGEKFHFDSKK